MGTTTEELKKLYSKLGGKDSNIPKASTPGEVLNGINELDLHGGFSGDYNDLTNKPPLGTASPKDVAASGDASSSQVVMGNDSRLTNRRGSTWGQINGTLANQTDLKGELDDIDNRIDSIIALPDGSTTADAELVDIRNGVHGQTFNSAGDAVRANANQLYNMKTGFDGVSYPTPVAMVQGCDQKIHNEVEAVGMVYRQHLLNYGFKNKSYIETQHGECVPDSDVNWGTSDYIPIPSGSLYLTSESSSFDQNNGYNAFYDIDKQFISLFAIPRNNQTRVRIPNTAAYMRMSLKRVDFEPLVFRIYTILEEINIIKSTMMIQGDIEKLSVENNKCILIFHQNNGGNLGYYYTYKYPNDGNATYFRNSTSISDDTYELSSEQCIVLSVNDNNNRLAVKSMQNVTEKDIIMLSYYAGQIHGLLYEFTTSAYADKINKKYKASNDDSVMRSICRFGEAYGLPESTTAIRRCHDAGFNIIRLNLQFTSDGIAVLWHDQYLNQHYKNVYDSSGNLVPYSTDNRISISGNTVSDLNNYRYGNANAPLGIPLAESAIKTARSLGMEIVFEAKSVFTAEDIETIKSITTKYGMQNSVSFACDHDNASLVAQNWDTVRIGTMDASFSQAVLDFYQTLKTGKNKLFWWGWDSMTLDESTVLSLAENGIEFECGDFDAISDIDTYLSNPWAWYCTGMEIQGKTVSPMIGQYISGLA